MTQLLVDGFGLYGTGVVVDGTGTQPVGFAMLSGVWAQLPNFQNALYPIGIGQLPWDPQNLDLYLYRTMRATSLSEGTWPLVPTYRRALPAAQATLIMGFHFATSFLPAMNEIICGFQDNSGNNLGFLMITSSGQICLVDGVLATTIQLISSGPVFVSQTDTHVEVKINFVAGTCEVRTTAGGTPATVAFNGSFTAGSAVNIAQVTFMTARYSPSVTRPTFYISHLICRSTAGATNNDFKGDRKVATLLVSSDDVANQGWSARPLLKFGNGILDLTAGDKTAITAPNTAVTNLGSGGFTVEVQGRFNILPTGSNKAVIFGKWDDGAQNKRSYQLYKAGPALLAGATVFQISTDGTAGTIAVVLSTTSWVPIVGQYYHICVERVSSVTTLYIDGLVVASAADANAYFAGTAPTCIGASVQGSSTFLTNTSFNGWMDEFRLTAGAYRYGAPFTAPIAAFPRGGFDALWANVGLICSFDNATVADESGNALTMSKWNGAVAITPADGAFNYQVMAKNTPFDGSFLAAAYLQASGFYTLSGVPANNDTFRLGTKDGIVAATYTWKTTLTGASFEVKIGANVAACLSNMVAAIIAGAGAGTAYGTGTTANFSATAVVQNGTQVLATALLPGTAGNAIVTTEVGVNSTWSAGTLLGGTNIPAFSQFNYARLPTDTTVVDSVTISDRAWKSDAGTATLQASWVGFAGGVSSGSDRAVSTVPTVYFDTFEVDPDGGGALSPVTVTRGKLRLNRTT